MRRIPLLLGLVALMPVPSFAADVSAAVAANFTKPAEELGKAFTAQTGDTVTFSFGATGALYTQLSQGAPFEVFLSADTKRPAQETAALSPVSSLAGQAGLPLPSVACVYTASRESLRPLP